MVARFCNSEGWEVRWKTYLRNKRTCGELKSLKYHSVGNKIIITVVGTEESS